MSVTTQEIPTLFPMGQADPRLPLALWWATPTSTGDATGGFNRARVLLARPYIYSVEAIGLLTNDAVAVFVNFSPGRTGYGWTFMATTIAGGGAFAAPGSDLRPSWGGLITQPGQAADAALDADRVNGLANTVEIDAWGYVWDQSALSLAGGPRRPRRTLFEPAGG